MNCHLDKSLNALTSFASPRSDMGHGIFGASCQKATQQFLPLIGPINRARKLPTHYSKNSNNAFWKRFSRVFKCGSTPQLWKLLQWCQAARLVCRRREPAQHWCGGVQHWWHKLQQGENSQLFHVSKHNYSNSYRQAWQKNSRLQKLANSFNLKLKTRQNAKTTWKEGKRLLSILCAWYSPLLLCSFLIL